MPRATLLVTLAVILGGAVCVVPAGSAAASGTAEIHIYAGGGDGDGSLATQALVPATGVIENGAGDVFIQTPGSIREVDHATGIISTVPGSQDLIASGGTITLAGTGSDGSLYVATTVPGDNTAYSTSIYQLKDSDSVPQQVGLTASQFVAVAPDGDIYSSGTNQLLVTSVGSSSPPTVVAGKGTFNHSGVGGPALHAELETVSEISVAPDGDPYFIDGHEIQYVDSSGDLQTAGGDGTLGGAQDHDGDPATSVALNPTSLSINADGVVYFDNNTGSSLATREIDSAGILHTADDGSIHAPSAEIAAAADAVLIASGSAVDSFAADGSDAHDTGTLIAGASPQSSSPDGTVATSDFLGTTGTPSFDPSRGLIFASNGLIRGVSAGRLTTFAGGGDPGDHYGDGGPALDAETHATDLTEGAAGVVYFTDSRPLNDGSGDAECRIREVLNDASHTVATVAGGGVGTIPSSGAVSATAVSLPCPAPSSLTADGSTVYFAASPDDPDSDSPLPSDIYRVSGGMISQVVGDGIDELIPGSASAPTDQASLPGVDGLGVSLSSGDLYAADSEGVVQVSGTTATRIIFWPAAVGPLAVGPDGSVYFSSNQQVYRLWPDGALATVVGGGDDSSDGTPVLHAGIGSGNLAVDPTSGELAMTSDDGISGDVITADPYTPAPLPAPASLKAAATPTAITLTVPTPPAGHTIEIYANESSEPPASAYAGTDVATVPSSSSSTSTVVVSTVDGNAVTTGHTYSFAAVTELDSPGGSDAALQASEPVGVTAVAAAPASPPAPAVTSLALTAGTGVASLTWHQPSGGLPAGDHIAVRRTAGRVAPTTATAGTLLYSGRATSYRATGLVAHKDYTFCLTTVSPTAPTSPARCVTALGTTVTSSAPASVKRRATMRASAHLRTSVGAIAGRVLSLQRASHGTWRALSHKTTTRSGAVTISLRPTATATYRIVFVGAGHDLGSVGKPFTVRVRH